jgi:hypothetical protein
MVRVRRISADQSAQGMTEYILAVVLVMLPFIETVRVLWKMVYDEYAVISLFVNLPFP